MGTGKEIGEQVRTTRTKIEAAPNVQLFSTFHSVPPHLLSFYSFKKVQQTLYVKTYTL